MLPGRSSPSPVTRVGIPRALLYYHYYPMWQTFFRELGAEVIVSPATTETTLARGAARVVADTCLPVKVFMGHVISLTGKCDCVFIPALRSVSRKTINCAKFLGLPDMTRAVVPEAPPILDPDIDFQKGKAFLYRQIYELGEHFTHNALRIRSAAGRAVKSLEDYNNLMVREQLTPPEAISHLEGNPTPVARDFGNPSKLTVAVVSHPYLLHDPFLNHRLIRKLRDMGCRVLTPEMAPHREKEAALVRTMGAVYWTLEEEIIGAGMYYAGRADVDGVIGVMAFGCGPDSLMIDMINRRSREQGKAPFMSISIDEHTAEAGLITRLEAFVDMTLRRKAKRAAMPATGASPCD